MFGEVGVVTPSPAARPPCNESEGCRAVGGAGWGQPDHYLLLLRQPCWARPAEPVGGVSGHCFTDPQRGLTVGLPGMPWLVSAFNSVESVLGS